MDENVIWNTIMYTLCINMPDDFGSYGKAFDHFNSKYFVKVVFYSGGKKSTHFATMLPKSSNVFGSLRKGVST